MQNRANASKLEGKAAAQRQRRDAGCRRHIAESDSSFCVKKGVSIHLTGMGQGLKTAAEASDSSACQRALLK